MKNLIRNISLILLGLLISFQAFSQINYSISGKVSNQHTKLTVAVKSIYKAKPKIDSISIIDGRLSFTGTLAKPGIVIMAIDFEDNGKPIRVPLFVSGGNIDVGILGDKNILISGNKDASECYSKISVPVQEWNKTISELDDKITEAARRNSVDTVLLIEEYNKAKDACFQVPEDFIKANPESLVSVQALYYMGRGKREGKLITLDDLEKLYITISPAIRYSDYGKQYAAELAKWKQKNN